jgi:hypothetical protein
MEDRKLFISQQATLEAGKGNTPAFSVAKAVSTRPARDII